MSFSAFYAISFTRTYFEDMSTAVNLQYLYIISILVFIFVKLQISMLFLCMMFLSSSLFLCARSCSFNTSSFVYLPIEIQSWFLKLLMGTSTAGITSCDELSCECVVTGKEFFSNGLDVVFVTMLALYCILCIWICILICNYVYDYQLEIISK